MRPTLHRFSIYRGLTWEGLRCRLLDSAGNAVTINAGTTALLQVRRAPGKDVEFALPVEIGENDGEVIIPEVSAATTATMPLGDWMYDLILIDSEGKPWPPIVTGTITVLNPVSVPS